MCKCSNGVVKFQNHSNGFRPGRSTLDNVLTLNEIIFDFRFKKSGKNRELFICFLDIAKAFDKVDREILFDRLWKIGITGKLWRIVKNVLTNFEGKIKIADLLTDKFNIDLGVILLFNIFLDEFVKKTQFTERSLFV